MSVSKTFKSIAALSLGTALLLTGCSSGDDAPQEDRTASSSAEVGKDKGNEEKPAEASPEEEAKEIAKVYDKYVSSLYSIDAAAIESILTAHQADVTEPTDEVAQQRTDELVAAAPDVWSGVDLESLDVQTRYAYVSMMSSVGALTSQTGSTYEASIDPSQIVVNGDTASIPTSGITASIDGEKIDTSSAEVQAPDLEFVKKNGEWKISPIGVAELTGGDTGL